MQAIVIIRKALSDLVDDLFTMLVINLFWLLLQLPLITAVPATLALYAVTNRKAHGEVIDVGDFFSAFKRYFWTAWRWGLLNLLVVFFLIGDYILTGRLSESATARIIQGAYLLLLAIWFWLQFTLPPFLFEQQTPSIWQALRNAAVLFGRNLAFSLAMAVTTAVAFALSIVFLLVVAAAGGFLFTLIANHIVIDRLAQEPGKRTAVAPS